MAGKPVDDQPQQPAFVIENGRRERGSVAAQGFE
jgi:hypothetical protein